MHAGPYIRAQIESAERMRDHFLREAKIYRDKAAGYEKAAAEAAADAHRWAQGTNVVVADQQSGERSK